MWKTTERPKVLTVSFSVIPEQMRPRQNSQA